MDQVYRRRPYSLKFYIFLIIIFLLGIFPVIIPSSYILHVMIMIFYYAFLAEAWNIIGGFVGYLSLCSAAFLGIGAYTSTVLLIWYGISPWFGMLIGALFSAISSIIIAYPCFRFKLRGAFFALSSLGFNEVIRNLFVVSKATGGSMGLLVPLIGDSVPYFQFTSKQPYYYIMLIAMMVGIFLAYKIRKSKLGLCLIAIREDADAASSLGINLTKYSLVAYAISAALSAIAGSFYASYVLYISPDMMSIGYSEEIVVIAIIGGLGTILGPIVASFILTPTSTFFRAWLGGGYRGVYLIVYGIIIIIVMMFIPEGASGLISRLVRALTRRK